MPPNREIKIIKVPLSDRERLPDYPQTFPKMPRMYLELLENKAKIKQDLINKEYVPKDATNEHGDADKDRQDRKHRKDDRTDRTESKSRRNRTDHKDDHKDRRDDREGYKNKHEKMTDDAEIQEEISTGSKPSHDSNESLKSIETRDSNESRESPESKESRESRELQESRESRDSNESRESPESRESRGSNQSQESGGPADSDDLSIRLKELLGESDDSRSEHKVDKYSRSHKQSAASKTSHFTPYETYKKDRQAPGGGGPGGVPGNAPTLAELEAKGHYQGKAELRDVNHVTIGEYDEEDKKRELIFKFDLLKKSYPTAAATVPEYTVHSDLREMQKSYDVSVRRLSLDSTVENYKQYLLGGFMFVEFVFGNFLGFDMQGFTQQQIVGMHNYERLLIELGEKSYVPSGSKWPVELRLLFVIIMNAGFFIVGKMILRKTGANLMGMMNSVQAPSPSADIPKQKRRMKGPNINLDNIPDVDEAKDARTSQTPQDGRASQTPQDPRTQDSRTSQATV